MRRILRTLVFASSFGLQLSGCGENPAKPATSPVLEGRIVFVSTREFFPQIYVMNATGVYQTRLTDHGQNVNPTWSPDGRKIGWTRQGSDSIGLYVMNADGTGQRNLTPGMWTSEPRWSPDGSKIAFSSQAVTDGFWSDQVFTMNVDGAGLTRLTTTAEGGYDPQWSPNGSEIAYLSSPTMGSNRDIYVMNVDGSNPVNLTKTAPLQANSHPSWSPDGTRLTFTSWRDGNAEIYVVDPKTAVQARVTVSAEDEMNPTWSPQGDLIAFQKNHEIWVMHPDGSAARLLSFNGGLPFSWAPDGRMIVFAAENVDVGRPRADIYSIGADGSSPVRLTRDGGNSGPQWVMP